jgi:hypothetical protein
MSDRKFLGLDIVGELIPSKQFKDQRPIEELAPLIQALIDEPEITEFGWEQYTPYFNDGDELVFGTGRFWARTARGEEGGNPGDWAVERNVDHLTLGYVYEKAHWEGAWPDRTWVVDSATYREADTPVYPPEEAERLWRLCQKVSEALDSKQFNRDLLEKFGDHATVTVKDGMFHIDRYSHD